MALELNGTTGVSLVQDDTITDAKLALDANASEIKDALNATGTAPIYACRAWVNFNGTGTVAIREDGNVSSITDNGTGDYTMNFTTAMPDANYSAIAASAFVLSGSWGNDVPNTRAVSSSAVRILNVVGGGVARDLEKIDVAVFR